MAQPVEGFQITDHAAFEMGRRGIDEATVRHVLAAPEQRLVVRSGRDVLQSRIAFGDRTHLVRVVVDVDRSPAQVVTVYRTSRIAKYWSPHP